MNFFFTLDQAKYTVIHTTIQLKTTLPRQARTDFYFEVILPSVTYGVLVWGTCGQVLLSNLESIHVRAPKIIFNLDWCMPGKEVLAAAKWNTSIEFMYEKR